MLNVLAYVHLRRIVRSTGAGRVARCLTENLSKAPGRGFAGAGGFGRLPEDHRRERAGVERLAALLVRGRQFRAAGALAVFGAAGGRTYWPEVQVTFCTAESYVPVKRSRLVVMFNDAAHLEPGVHRGGAALWKQRLKWNYLYRVLERKADPFQACSHFRPNGWRTSGQGLQAVARGAARCGALFL